MGEEREVVLATKRSDLVRFLRLRFRIPLLHYRYSNDLSAATCRKVVLFMKKISTKNLCLMGIFTAITVILGIYATFRIGNQIKIPAKFISVFVTGTVFGPLAGGLVAAVADFLNSVLVPVGPPLPQITLVEFICGAVYGLCFYKVTDNWFYYLRAVLCAILQFAISMTIMSFILADVGYFASFGAACAIRFPAAVISFVIQLAVMCIMKKFVFTVKEFTKKDGRR